MPNWAWGKFAMGTVNDNGKRLRNFSLANSFMAANCLAERQPRHSYTWESFDGVYRNQIDYFLVQERWRSAVCNCRAYQGPDCDSDHSLVKLKFKLRLRRLQRRSATAQYEYANAGQFAVELRSSQLNSATGSLPWRYGSGGAGKFDSDARHWQSFMCSDIVRRRSPTITDQDVRTIKPQMDIVKRHDSGYRQRDSDNQAQDILPMDLGGYTCGDRSKTQV